MTAEQPPPEKPRGKHWYQDPVIVVPAVSGIVAAVVASLVSIVAPALLKEHPSSARAAIHVGDLNDVTSEGQRIEVSGISFDADTLVWLTVDGKYQQSALVSDGGFDTFINLSTPLDVGRHVFLAKGQQSGVQAEQLVNLKSG